MKYYFTFGFDQPHAGGYHIIEAVDSEAARTEMFRRFGMQWSFQYDSEDAAGVKEFSLDEVKWNGISYATQVNLMKQRIDQLGYKELLTIWRFNPTGHILLRGEVGQYCARVIAKKKEELEPGEAVRISKEVGW